MAVGKTKQSERIKILLELGTEHPGRQLIVKNLGQDLKRYGRSKSQSFSLLVQDAKGRVVGGLVCLKHWNWIYIQLAWVKESHRGQGILGKLMKHLEAQGNKWHVRGYYIDTFDNKVARIYQKFGFRVFGQIPGFPKAGAIRTFLFKKSIFDK